MLRESAPMRKRSKCWWTSQQPGGPKKALSERIVSFVHPETICFLSSFLTAKAGGYSNGAIGGLNLNQE